MSEASQNRARAAMQFFIGRGWKAHQAAGIVGNLIAESNLDPNVAPGDNGTAFGVAQWRGDRLSGLKNFASEKGKDWKDFDTQLAWVDHELRDPAREGKAGQLIMNAQDVTKAAEGMIMFERPLGSNKGAAHAHNYSGRVAFSRNALEWSGETAPIGELSFASPYDDDPINPAPRQDQYSDTPAPLQVPTIVDQVAAETAISDMQYGSFAEEVDAGFASYAYAPWMMKRLSEGATDLEYLGPSQADWQDITATLPENYHDGLLSAGSDTIFRSRLKSYMENHERIQRLEAGGWSGTAGAFLGSFLDPVGLTAGIATGGLGSGLVVGSGVATRVTVGALSAGISNAAIEAGAGQILKDPNTDPAMAFVVGAGFGALGAALSRSPRTRVEAEAAYEASTKTLNPNRFTPVPSSIGTSAGAMANPTVTGELIDGPWTVRDSQVPEAVGGRLRIDVAGQMTTSDDPITRMVGSALFDTMLTHVKEEGGKVLGLGSQQWEPAILTKFQYTLHRYTNRLVQSNDYGGLSKWMSNPVASLFMQFRSFVFGSWAKSTLYAAHHMDPRMLVLITGELAAGVATYAVREAPKALATDDWSKLEDPKNLITQGIGRMATASVLPMLADTALTFTPVGPQFGNARASGSPTDALFGSPTVGHIKDLAGSSSAVMESLWADRELTQGELNTLKRSLVPMQNQFVLSSIWAKMIEGAPE